MTTMHRTFMRLLVLSVWAVSVRGEDIFPAKGSPAEGWSLWSALPETAPKLTVKKDAAAPALEAASAGNPAVFGGWVKTVPGIEAGKWYRLTAAYRAQGVPFEWRQVMIRLDWSTGEKRAGQPHYAWRYTRSGETRRATIEAQAPAAASQVKVQLLVTHAAQARVAWTSVAIEEIPAPRPREVTVAAIRFRPQKLTPEQNVARFIEVADKLSPPNTDIILLPEGITVVGTGKKYPDVAEPLPSPTTRTLGEFARKRNAYIVAGVYEKEGSIIYNTAVLIDRKGNLAGKYRKVYIPREEMEGGITPCSDYPVFETDFGKVGMMICYDVFYADPARGLAAGGAELILMPIWGGPEPLARARADENNIFLATSGYDYPASIIDPNGEVLVTTSAQATAAVRTVDLNRPYEDRWLGDMRGRYFNELRLDAPIPKPR